MFDFLLQTIDKQMFAYYNQKHRKNVRSIEENHDFYMKHSNEGCILSS